MRTKTINKDSNLIRITFNKVPETGTMSKLSAALDLIDSSVNAICDSRISEALDTSSIQELWNRFREFDFVTAAALSDLDYRITVTDSSLGNFDSQNQSKFSEVNNSLSDLSNAIVGVRNDLNQHIIDTSDISGTVKPEDIAEYLQPLYSGIADVSTRLANHINEYVSVNPSTIENLTTAINQINTSLGLNGYFDHIRDVSINTLTEYVHTTVDSLLTSYTQRLNSTESIAVDAMAVANDVSTHFTALNNNVNYIVDNFNSSIYSRFDEIDSSINATIDERFAVINSSLAVYQENLNNSFTNYQTEINSSFSNYQNYIDSSLIGWGNIIEERDFVISRALTQLDTSIVWLINRLTALQQS